MNFDDLSEVCIMSLVKLHIYEKLSLLKLDICIKIELTFLKWKMEKVAEMQKQGRPNHYLQLGTVKTFQVLNTDLNTSKIFQ